MQRFKKTLSTAIIFLAVTFFIISFSNALAGPATKTQLGCTSTPDLLDDYKIENLGPNATDKDIKDFFERHRDGVKNKKDPFSKLWPMTKSQRDAIPERVLWENDEIGVLVDKYHSKPKPLIIPKGKMNFIVDASPELRKHLAVVAAATSDAIIKAAGKQFEPCSVAQIYIHPPDLLGVKQLHIHVEPKYGLQDFGNLDAFYNRVENFLKDALNDLEGTRSVFNVKEASGIARHGDDLFIISDRDHGVYYRAYA